MPGEPIRTSLTHPLRIDEVAVPGTAGRIGLMQCPGRGGFSFDGRPWRRDLTLDVEAIRAWGADLVVSLLEDFELAESLELPDFRIQVARSGLAWEFAPFPDGAAPHAEFETTWLELGPRVRATLRGGGRVALHCRAGLGRTGTIAARLLVEFGVPAREAVRLVRASRRGAIETRAQLRHLEALEPLAPGA